MKNEMLNYAAGLFGEIEEALGGIGMRLRRLDPEETRGVPTGVVTIEGDTPDSGWQILCTVAPAVVEEVSTTFVQLWMRLLPPFPQQRELLDGFVKGCNEGFILGSLLLSEDALVMKYTLALEPLEELDPPHFQAAVFAFCSQAKGFAQRGLALCQGELTLEEALRPSAVR